MRTYHNLTALVVSVIAVLSFAACADAPDTAPTPTPGPNRDVMVTLNEPFEMGEGFTAFINAEGFTIEYGGVVSDNRCAVDVVCITAGRAVVEFKIRETSSAPFESYLFGIGDTGPEPSSHAVGPYRIRITRLFPLPHSDGRALDYRAVLTVVEDLPPVTLELNTFMSPNPVTVGDLVSVTTDSGETGIPRYELWINGVLVSTLMYDGREGPNDQVDAAPVVAAQANGSRARWVLQPAAAGELAILVRVTGETRTGPDVPFVFTQGEMAMTLSVEAP